MKRRKSDILKSLERAAKPLRRRNRRVHGVKNMVEQVIIYLSKRHSKVLSQAAEASGVGRSEQASLWMAETIEAVVKAIMQERIKKMETDLAARLAGQPVVIPDAKG